MKFTHSLLAGAVALALAAGTALAQAKPKDPDPGFNALDKDNDGYVSRTEAQRNPHLAKRFKDADSDGDGKLSRTEYLAVMAKKDLNTAREKVGEAIKPDDKGRAGAGSTRAKDADPGFNALDKDNDGALSRTEAMGNPELAKKFKQADKDGDGKLSRAEYLAVMAKKDFNTAREKVGEAIKPDKPAK